MKQSDIFILHGMGEHKQNWSARLQSQLSQRLTAIGVQPTFHEPNYCHIVAARAKVQSYDEHIDKEEQLAIDLDIARMEGAIDGFFGPEDAPEVDVAGWYPENPRKVLRDLNEYAIRYIRERSLRTAIHTCVMNTLDPIAENAESSERPLILIGHSLGSVVFWHLLQDRAFYLSSRVSCLVTLASPLGWLRLAHVIAPDPVQPRWINAGTPGDVVCSKPIKDPPFKADGGFSSISTRRFPADPHSGLLHDPDVVSDWAGMLA